MRNPTCRMRYGTAVLLGVLLAANVVFGQDNPASGFPSVNEKSLGKAFKLCLIGAALPVVTPIAILAAAACSSNPDKMGYAIALIFAPIGAAIIGPSPGYFYAGLFGRGVLGMGIRAAGIATLLLSLYEESDELFGTGLAVVAGSTIWDLVKIKSAVNKRNERKRAVSLNITPVYIPKSKSYGINFQIQF